jgi:peptidoglycan/LPS O-acetylase OafA/YrhL
MNAFEFVFPLFALLVGLSMAEMLTGLANALKSKREVRVGWLTPLLGMLILINLVMFWQGSWQIRDAITPDSSTLLLVLVVGGTYFLAASMLFPLPGANVHDLDEHFMRHRKVVLLAIAGCNMVYFVRIAVDTKEPISPWWWAGNALFLALLLLAALVRDRRIILATVATLVLAHGILLFVE